LLKDNWFNNYLVTRVFRDRERPYLKTNNLKTNSNIKCYNTINIIIKYFKLYFNQYMNITFFENKQLFRDWLEKNHLTKTEIIV
jgi:hypothetical protein